MSGRAGPSARSDSPRRRAARARVCSSVAALAVTVAGAGLVAVVTFENACSLPAGPAIAFLRQEPVGNGTYVVSPTEGCVREGISLPAESKILGDQVVFTDTRHDGREIYVGALSGGNRRRLTDSNGLNVHPDRSPDGASIAFVSTRDGDHEIHVMNMDGSGEKRLTDFGGQDVAPRWVSDGPRFVPTSASRAEGPGNR